jgi:hypothetical protein
MSLAPALSSPANAGDPVNTGWSMIDGMPRYRGA